MKNLLAGKPDSWAWWWARKRWCWQVVNIRGSRHWVPQPLEQHFVVPLHTKSELHSKSQELEAAGMR